MASNRESKKVWKEIGKKMGKKFFFLFTAVGLTIFMIHVLGYGHYLSVDKLLMLIKKVPDNWYVFALFELTYMLGSWVLFPLTATALLATLVFPLWKAVLSAVLGVFLSGTFSYIVGRYFFNLEKSKKYKKHINLVKQEFNQYGYWAVTAMRLSPQPPFIATSVLCGALRFNYIKYLAATYLGLSPMLVITFLLGKKALDLLKDPSTIAASLLLALIILIPIFNKFKNRLIQFKTVSHRN